MLPLLKALFPWLGIFFSIILGIMVIPPSLEGIQIANDAPHYRSTRADVLRHYEQKREKGPSSYVVEFSYKVKKRTLNGSNERTIWSDSQPEVKALLRREEDNRQTMLVYYDPEHPDRVVIHKEVPKWPHVLWISGTVAIFLFSLLFAGASVSRRRYLKRSRRRLEGV